MSRRQAIEAALWAWRDAERQLAAELDGEGNGLRQQVTFHRDQYQRLSAENMVEWMGKLQEAEGRRSHATPSTAPFQ